MPRTSIPDLHEKYREGEPLTMLTAYDAPVARQSTAAASTVLLYLHTGATARIRAADTEVTYSSHCTTVRQRFNSIDGLLQRFYVSVSDVRPMSEIELSEMNEVFEEELTFPATSEEVIDECGDATLRASGGDGATVADLIKRGESDEFESTEELVNTLMTFVDDDYVGRIGYSDRGDNPEYDDEESV